MGRKTIYFALGMGGFAGLFRLIALFLPLDKVSIDTVTSQEMLSLTTTCLSVEVDMFRGVCSHINSTLCSNGEKSMSLSEGSKQFCSTAFENALRYACLGLKRAHTFGMILVVVVVVAYILQASSGWFMHRYLTIKATKQYRENALMMTGISGAMMFLMLLIYWIFVLAVLDDIKPKGAFRYVTQQNKGSTASIGYLLLWLSVVLEVASAVFLNLAKSSDEDEMLQAELELEQTWAAGPPGYVGGPPGPYNQSGFEGGQPGFDGGWGQPTPGYDAPGWGQPGM